MNKYLFVTIPELGHINPMIGTAQRLQQTGHKVFFVSTMDIRQTLEDFGLCFLSHLTRESPPESLSGADLVELVQDKERLRQWVEALLCQDLEGSIPLYQACFDDIKPDCVVIDPLLCSPAIAAHIKSIPWVALSNSMNPVLPKYLNSDLLKTVQKINPYRYEILRKYSLDTIFRGCDILSPHLTIAFTTPQVSGFTENTVHQVGPTLSQMQGSKKFRRRYPDRPLIYASFGSQIYYWPDFFARLIEASQNLDIELALSVGKLINDPFFQFMPSWVQVFNYAPQNVLLKESDIFITHGGANSFMESIFYKTPMIINPICNDQFHQSYFVKKNGLGIHRNLIGMSTLNLRNLIKSCLDRQDWYSGLDLAHQSYQTDGSGTAATLIEALC